MRRALLVAERELRAERAQPDGLFAALGLTLVLVFLESLLFGPSVAREPAVAAGLTWIALAFAAMLATTRSFDRELEDDAIDAILALPGGRDALYAGKVLALTGLLGIVAFAGVLLTVVLLDLDVTLPLHLALVTALGTVAVPPLVTLYVALSLRLRARALVVPVLVLPVLLPQLAAATAGTAAAISGDATGALGWSGLLVATALVSGVTGLTIGPVAIE
ncbi:MAG TPA: heme exporter protein CcmB [Candidatus Limnocylindria bacterium]|nr:heme exporter protein CcmB [Candidatus Limnocylindria bacterium]